MALQPPTLTKYMVLTPTPQQGRAESQEDSRDDTGHSGGQSVDGGTRRPHSGHKPFLLWIHVRMGIFEGPT